MRIYYKGKIFSSERIWFENFKSYNDVKKIKTKGDNIVIFANQEKIYGSYANCSKQESLVSTLNMEMEMIMQNFSSTTRNEIRRAEREQVQVRFYSSDTLITDSKILKRMSLLYTNMYTEKGILNRKLPIAELNAYAQSGCLLISVAVIDDVEVVFHSYIVSQNKARLLQSCSEFRVADNAMRNAIGRANKYLHYCDMKYLQKMGIEEYDWGGITSYTEPNGIDKFKMSFGGTFVEYFNVRYIKSCKQKVFERIMKRNAERGNINGR